VQNKQRFRELHRVYGAVSTSDIVLDDLEDTGTAKALERLSSLMLITALSEIQGMTKEFSHF
jgi:hypothetical protein